MKLNKQVCTATAGVIGTTFFILGTLIYGILPLLIRSKVMEALKLVNNSFIFNNWVELPLPIHMKVYLFNVTNAVDILSKSSKPILQEIGPFTFREYRKKRDINFSDDKDIVTYSEVKTFEYLPDESIGSLMDQVTILNVPLMCIAKATEKELTLLQKMVLPQLIKVYNSTPFITKTVDEVLFKGYQDKLIKFLQEHSGENVLPNGIFGLLRQLNQSVEHFSVYTGVKNPNNFMQLHKWNNLSSVPWWDSHYCNMINGSDGTAFKPFLTPDDKLPVFLGEFCRSLYLEYEDTQYMYGIKMYRFRIPAKILTSPDIEPDNKCFCKKNKQCVKSGVADLSTCQKNTPVVASLPHFYQGDDTYYNAVIGLNRNETRHEIIINVEPFLGITTKVHKRAQVNIAVEPFTHIKSLSNFTNMLFPVVWIDEYAQWDDAFAQNYNDMVFKPQILIRNICYALIVIGIATLIVTTFGFIVPNFIRKKQRLHNLKYSVYACVSTHQ